MTPALLSSGLKHRPRFPWPAVLSAALALGLAVPAGRAAPLIRDLGRGLSYCRIHVLPGDLNAALPAASPIVLDLRYVSGGPGQALALDTWVRARASVHRPVFLLLNGSTSPGLLDSLADKPPHGLLFIGPASRSFKPDVVVAGSGDADRRAYESLEHGAAVESLVQDSPPKTRIDEALLEKEHLRDADMPDPSDVPAPDEAEGAAGRARPGPVDGCLQAAVRIHRGLLALRRL